jgi:hypothetical protein
MGGLVRTQYVCIRMYVCICIHTYSASYIHTYIHTYMQRLLYIYIYMHAYKHTHTHTCIHICTHTNTSTHLRSAETVVGVTNVATFAPLSYDVTSLHPNLVGALIVLECLVIPGNNNVLCKKYFLSHPCLVTSQVCTQTSLAR